MTRVGIATILLLANADVCRAQAGVRPSSLTAMQHMVLPAQVSTGSHDVPTLLQKPLPFPSSLTVAELADRVNDEREAWGEWLSIMLAGMERMDFFPSPATTVRPIRTEEIEVTISAPRGALPRLIIKRLGR